MKEYKVRVTETLVRVVTIKADSFDDADTIVRDMYDMSEIVLDEGDFLDVEFSNDKDGEDV